MNGYHTTIMASVLVLSILACERSAEWPVTPGHGSRLVVESILTNELHTQEVWLTTTYDNLNDVPVPVLDAAVSVSAGGTTYLFDADPVIPGRYLSQAPFAVVSQLIYTLTLEWNGNIYSANAALSEVAPIPPIIFTPADTLGHFMLSNNVVPVFNEVQQAMYQFDLDWSHIQPEGQNTARLFFYTFNTIHISEFLRPDNEDVFFPSGTIAVITKYGLTDDFAEYLRSVAIETTWNGILFYGNPENPVSNLSNEALGYFAACAVLHDTIIVQ
jgi:hypothetical protein